MENFDYTISIGQLGEQLTLNQWVLGPSPRWCTKKCLAVEQGVFYICICGKQSGFRRVDRKAKKEKFYN